MAVGKNRRRAMRSRFWSAILVRTFMMPLPQPRESDEAGRGKCAHPRDRLKLDDGRFLLNQHLRHLLSGKGEIALITSRSGLSPPARHPDQRNCIP
jgi:hypothetical protein